MANKPIKKLQTKLKKMVQERNEKIAQTAVLGKMTYDEIAKKFGVSKQRVKQILVKYHIKVPLRRGFEKHKRWKQRISKSLKKKK